MTGNEDKQNRRYHYRMNEFLIVSAMLLCAVLATTNI